jgi:hypothetical protein
MDSARRFDLGLVAIFLVASGVVSLVLGQDTNWDLRNYHFYNAHSFLNGRLMYDVAPAQIQTYINPLPDLPVYWMITNLPPAVCGFILGAVPGLNIWLLYRISFLLLGDIPKRKRRWLSVFAAITGFFGAANISEIGTTFYDNITSLFVLSAILITVKKFNTQAPNVTSTSRFWVIAAGFLLGCGTGIKLPVAVYSIGYLFSILILKCSLVQKAERLLLSGFGIGLGIFATLGYWMYVLWTHFQNPLFPFYNKVFNSPYYILENFSDDRFLPRSGFQGLFYPFYFFSNPRLVGEVWFRDVRFLVCYVLFALFAGLVIFSFLTRRAQVSRWTGFAEKISRGDPTHAFLIAFFVLSYVVWQVKFSIYRYVIPLEFLSPVFIVVMLMYVVPKNWKYLRISFFIFVVIILFISPMNWGRTEWTENYFEVGLPDTEDMETATVIMADNQALSYIIPSFPEGTRFVSVNNNFMDPYRQTKLQEIAESYVRKSTGDIYLLHDDRTKEDYASILSVYGLIGDYQNKRRISTKIDSHLSLVPTTRFR